MVIIISIILSSGSGGVSCWRQASDWYDQWAMEDDKQPDWSRAVEKRVLDHGFPCQDRWDVPIEDGLPRLIFGTKLSGGCLTGLLFWMSGPPVYSRIVIGSFYGTPNYVTGRPDEVGELVVECLNGGMTKSNQIANWLLDEYQVRKIDDDELASLQTRMGPKRQQSRVASDDFYKDRRDRIRARAIAVEDSIRAILDLAGGDRWMRETSSSALEFKPFFTELPSEQQAAIAEASAMDIYRALMKIDPMSEVKAFAAIGREHVQRSLIVLKESLRQPARRDLACMLGARMFQFRCRDSIAGLVHSEEALRSEIERLMKTLEIQVTQRPADPEYYAAMEFIGRHFDANNDQMGRAAFSFGHSLAAVGSMPEDRSIRGGAKVQFDEFGLPADLLDEYCSADPQEQEDWLHRFAAMIEQAE